MDNDYSIDLREVGATLGSADVVVLRFITSAKRLLLDFRTTDLDAPFIGVVDPVRSAKERYEELRRIRPRFEAPERIHVIWWPRFIASLVSTGTWERVLTRLAAGGHDDSAATDALGELLRLESDHALAAISGDGFRTLWAATPSAG